MFRFGDPLVARDRAAVDWWAVITATDGSVETIAGTSLLRFGPDGRVIYQRDAWASEPGRHELPAWAPTASAAAARGSLLWESVQSLEGACRR